MDLNTRLNMIRREIGNIAQDYEAPQTDCCAALADVVKTAQAAIDNLAAIRDDRLRAARQQRDRKDAQIAARSAA